MENPSVEQKLSDKDNSVNAVITAAKEKDTRQKAVLLIAAHCHPVVLKMTLGTWLIHYDGSYDADVYVSLHKNYHHYFPKSGLDEIKAMEGAVRLIFVDEINWSIKDQLESMMRYSTMHAICLQAMMKEAAVKSGDFTHVAVLDHDLIFKDDFVLWAMQENADMVGCLLDDRSSPTEVQTHLGMPVTFAPKISAWHLVISRFLFDMAVKNPSMVEPCYRDHRMHDTLSLLYEVAQSKGLAKIFPSAEIEKHVKHLWGMSFNYGLSLGRERYEAILGKLSEDYVRMFPRGIDNLLMKLRCQRG